MLKGTKSYLTGVERENLEQLRNWRNDPNLRRYFREYREITREMQERWYAERVHSNPNQVDFEIHRNDNGKLIGHCGLYYINWQDSKAEFTIYIGDMDSRGGGFGSSALRTLVAYGFNELNLNRIWCEVYSNNTAVDLYRHLGFRDEGVLRQSHYCEGEYVDSTLLGLMRADWREKCPTLPSPK